MSDRFTVTGPDCDRRAESAGVGLSAAVTCASRASRAGRVASYYVRDPSGLLVGRADADEAGCVQVLGERALRAANNGVADRASASGTAASLVDGRPGSPRRPDEGGEMAEQKTRARRKTTTKASPARTAPSEATADEADAETRGRAAAAAKGDGGAKAAEKAEKGTDLLATLMRLVEEQVPGAKRAPNKSQTYTRLQTSAGKTFAYIFPPREAGLAVKIPRQLLEVAAELPSGHGFKTTGWGLTRTMTRASEAPVVARSLAAAAKRVSPEGGGS